MVTLHTTLAQINIHCSTAASTCQPLHSLLSHACRTWSWACAAARDKKTAGVTVYSSKPPDGPICTAIER